MLDTERAADVRLKGNSVRFYVSRAGEVRPARSSETFHADDALRFVVSTGAPTYFLLLGVEASGRVSAYYPFEGSRSTRLDAGIDQALPGSLVLDDSSDTEYFLAVFSPKPVDLADVQAAVRFINIRDLVSSERERRPVELRFRWPNRSRKDVAVLGGFAREANQLKRTYGQ